MRLTAVALVVIFLPGAALALAGGARPVLQGRWIATAGPRTFRGTWSAQALPDDANAAAGSWTLLGDADNVVLQGTWSAKKTPRAWRGTWQARIQPAGETLSGTWQAALTTEFKGKTFEDMLQAVGTQQIAGTWRTSRAGGNWWLPALP